MDFTQPFVGSRQGTAHHSHPYPGDACARILEVTVSGGTWSLETLWVTPTGVEVRAMVEKPRCRPWTEPQTMHTALFISDSKMLKIAWTRKINARWSE